ncbi:hypothetical protein, partial [Bacillus smithii]|uniref:hypothetical protein n=1 Tax=Bacillus smithii TaxID=1479 RepID=UPI001C3F7475
MVDLWGRSVFILLMGIFLPNFPLILQKCSQILTYCIKDTFYKVNERTPFAEDRSGNLTNAVFLEFDEKNWFHRLDEHTFLLICREKSVIVRP